MARPNVKRRHSDLHFESVARISSLPIVENSINIAGNVYDRIKIFNVLQSFSCYNRPRSTLLRKPIAKESFVVEVVIAMLKQRKIREPEVRKRSNSLMNWSLGTAEQSLAIATASAKPAIYVLNRPITTIDHLLCKGIDIVEQRVPAVHLPPHLMYCNAREYVNNKIVRPVLIRAGSVKQIGSQAANAAADRLDGALTVADKYVDHYLPADPADKVADEVATLEPVSKTTRTMKHGARFSRKLQKRLTNRTLAEARALKDQGTECIHVLLYVAELLATDPKLALQKAKELWATLSLPEPENQARPASLEQLLVLLTRESARRVVHLMNGTSTLAAKTPCDLGRILIRVSHQLLAVADATLKMVPLIGKMDAVNAQISVMRSAIERLNSTTNHLLEQFASFLAGRPSASKVTHAQSHQQNHNNHMSMSSNPPVNGIE